MKKTNKWSLSTLVAGLLVTSAVFAHHSFSQFDRNTEMVTSGTVVRWAFNNPHSWLYINVANDDGSETLWSFEASAPPSLIGRGITGATFEPGDSLQLMFCPLRDGRPGGALGWVQVEGEDFVNPSDGGCNGGDASIERWKGWLEMGYTSSADAPDAN